MEAFTYDAAVSGQSEAFEKAVCAHMRPFVLQCKIDAIKWVPALVRICHSGPEFFSNNFVRMFQMFIRFIEMPHWGHEYARPQARTNASLELPGLPKHYDVKDAFDSGEWDALEKSVLDGELW
jgi:hypothetical protein